MADGADAIVIATASADGRVASLAASGDSGSGESLSTSSGDGASAIESRDTASHTSRMLAAGSVAAALLLVVVGRDLIITPQGADQPGAIRLLQLFTYNYRRGWPDSLDFSAAASPASRWSPW